MDINEFLELTKWIGELCLSRMVAYQFISLYCSIWRKEKTKKKNLVWLILFKELKIYNRFSNIKVYKILLYMYHSFILFYRKCERLKLSFCFFNFTFLVPISFSFFPCNHLWFLSNLTSLFFFPFMKAHLPHTFFFVFCFFFHFEVSPQERILCKTIMWEKANPRRQLVNKALLFYLTCKL